MSKLFPMPVWIKNNLKTMYIEEFLEAVVHVYVEWKQAGLDPGSDYLAVSTRNRILAERDVEQKWHDIVADRHGVDPEKLDYPYHSDFVMRTWVSFRKSGGKSKDRVFEHYGLHCRTADWKDEEKQEVEDDSE